MIISSRERLDPASISLSKRSVIAIVLITTIVFMGLGLFAVRAMGPKYKATMVVAPPLLKDTRQQTSSIGAGLLNLTAQAPPSFLRFQDLMSSTRIAQALIEHHHLDHIVFRDWYETPDARRGGGMMGWLRALLGLPAPSAPDAVSLAAFLEKAIKITKSPQSNAVTLSYLDKNSDVAKNILKWVYDETEAAVVKDAQVYYGNSVPYLEQRLQEVTNQAEKQSLTQLLIESEEQLMLVNYAGVYAAEVVDGPYTPARPAKPNALLVLVLSIIAGPLVSLGWVFGRRGLSALHAQKRRDTGTFVESRSGNSGVSPEF